MYYENLSVMMKINKDVTIITCSSMERGATLQLYLVIPKTIYRNTA